MKLQYQEEIADIYGLLADDTSRYIFGNRLLYNLTGDRRYIRNIICTDKEAGEFVKNMCCTDEPAAVFGAGLRAKKFLEFYPEVKCRCFIDNYKNGMEIHGIPVISLKEFMQEYRAVKTRVIILPRYGFTEIEEQLGESGVDDRDILNFARVMDHLYKRQYFDLPQLRTGGDGIFIDGGALDGDDSLKFVRAGGGGKLYSCGNPIPLSSVRSRKK